MQHERAEGQQIFGIDREDLKRRCGLVTASEITGQPALWRALADVLEAQSKSLEDFLQVPFAQQDLLVVFTGAGTSAFAGGVVAAEAMSSTGREMRRIANTDLVEGWSRHLDPSRPILLVSFGRSGDSPESVAAMEVVEKNCRHVWQLVVTCNPQGALARSVTHERRHALVMPEGSCDQGFAMTGSFTAMTLAALAIFVCPTPSAGAPIIRRMAADAEHILSSWPVIGELARVRHERVVFLGSGAMQEACAECALKLLELTDGEVFAVSHSPLGFRHGPKTIINGRQTLIVNMISGDLAVRPYGLDMAEELVRDGRADMFALTPEPGICIEGMPSLGVTSGEPLLSDGWLAVHYVVFGQMFAFLTSQAGGHLTDQPSRSGEVNRVVQNVAIYA